MTDISPEEAEELTAGLGQIHAGGWRMTASLIRVGVPKALGLTNEEWVQHRLGGTVKLQIEERREAVLELDGEDMSQREIAAALGVDQKTVSNDLKAGEENSSPEPETPSLESIIEENSSPDPESSDPELIPPRPEPKPEPISPGAKEILDEIENAPSLQDAQYRHEFSKKLGQVQGLMRFDAERIGRLADDVLLKTISNAQESLTAFRNAVENTVKENSKIRRIK